MATVDHRGAAQGNPLAGLIRSGRFGVSVVRKVSKKGDSDTQFVGSHVNVSFAGRNKAFAKWFDENTYRLLKETLQTFQDEARGEGS